VIGLETHVQLGTASKIFTAASTAFDDDPNTHIDPAVCGLPGTLPVLHRKVINRKVLEYAVKAAMALNPHIAEHSKFDRKQYFYPDLPRNYRISQYDEPITELRLKAEELPELLEKGCFAKALVAERGLAMSIDPSALQVVGRQDQAAGLLRGAADEAHRRPGRPPARQTHPQRAAEGLCARYSFEGPLIRSTA
jgi:aspartyl-tRNA(Asn)/glutamyl-tRNA(Gln) amidotransferase subunit B